MIEIILTEGAENDLVDIIEYIARDNPKRAKAYAIELLGKAENTISTFPFSCPLHNKKLNIRKFIYGKYNVYYQYIESEEKAYILHVFNSALLENTIIKNG
jgi:plasmid stabilization system protein ParE